MENNQKPEWFELADNDQPVSRRLKNKVIAPKRNLAFILAGVLVLPMGAGFALLSHEDQSASAVETLNLTQDSPAIASSAPARTSNTITMPAKSRGEGEGEDDDYTSPTFASTAKSSNPVVTPAVSQSAQNSPVATVLTTKSPAATATTASVETNTTSTPTARATRTRVTKAPTTIKPPSSSSTSKDLILPPTKKAGDDENDDEEEDDD